MSNIKHDLNNTEKKVMKKLKDFQISTVERIDELYRHGQKRVLVSDEVGLGKTHVAKGTIAKFAKLRQEEGDNLVKVVYICSNTAIAEQNIENLQDDFHIKVENANTSRLSMQHLNIFLQENDEEILKNFIQIIPLTPQTSLKLTNSQGIVEERALMYTLLKRTPNLIEYAEELKEIFRDRVDIGKLEDHISNWENQVELCNQKSNGEYINYMINELLKKSEELLELKELCKIIKSNTNEDIDDKKASIIQKFRIIFADISLNKLNPDLIIMDEFQRFNDLLNNNDKDSERDKLISKFFDMEDLRILMLSATPYKMYSTLNEIYEKDLDSHYDDFFKLMEFLTEPNEDFVNFKSVWDNYSEKLTEYDKDYSSFIEAKNEAENKLYESICRTERISENQLTELIDDSDARAYLEISKEDIESFKEAQKLLDDMELNINVPVDYIKSTPYIMSFMENYKLKKKIENYFTENPQNDINMMNQNTFWLNKSKIDNYEKIPHNNARLENLMKHVLKNNAERLLWVPPSIPYYKLSGAFENSEYFSKTLVFSSWEMVPRMISSMVSYEIERRTIGKLKNNNPNIRYFGVRYPSPRLRFDQMSLFTLLYPSVFLVDVYNPKDCLNRNLSLEEIEKEIKEKINEGLNKIPHKDSGSADSRWYYLAPLLLDNFEHNDLVANWFEDMEYLIKEKYSEKTNFKENFNIYKHNFENLTCDFSYVYLNQLNKKPDDLVDVLCNMALASPSVCAYRLFKNEFEYDSLTESFNKFSSDIGRSFIQFMNRPESIAVIDLEYKSISNDAYWKNVLKYSKDGNLQAVFDEYAHLISGGICKNDIEICKKNVEKITKVLLSSLNLFTPSYEFDTFENFKTRIIHDNNSKKALRSHFAVAFKKGKNEKSDANRKKSVREAFNSPFRPFVLASTSIGQEGLDFHNYCRRIVHWNLPSNPIDLEQREGRINRFKCLAIRQNVAKRYNGMKFKTNDIWNELFNEANKHEKNNQCSDLIPYWGLKDSEDMIKIERIVPMYPYSKDGVRYQRLIELLYSYRLTLGQPRQEYVADTIFRKFNKDKTDFNKLLINLSPYYKSD